MHSNKQQAIRQSSFKLPSGQASGYQAVKLQATKQQACRLSLAAFFLACNVLACSLAAVSAANAAEIIYIVNDYRYLPANASDDRDIGLSLCGTRCNALTTDYLNITDVGGWLLMKGAANTEVTVELNSPFIKGQCICIADEYLVKIDDRYSEERRRPGKQK